MNIFKNKTPEDKKYAGSSRRSTAATIDIWLVLFLRVFFLQIVGSLWLNQEIISFMARFQEHFGTETVKNNREHIDYILSSTTFYYVLCCYILVVLIGAFYHAYLNSSAWHGTIGKRVMKIVIVKENEKKLSFGLGMWHYFLSILPFAYILYLLAYQMQNHLTFYQSIASSEANVFFGILFILWVQIHLFTKRKTTAYDLICNTVLLNGKTSAKFPWSKKHE